jgi:DsbC/DsbD-like thiol-disulfide interchange protein
MLDMSKVLTCALAVSAALSGTAAAQGATPWTEGYNSKTRMIASAIATTGAPRVVAGVEVAMAPGWKTYWRNPGDAGGVPPNFDWAASTNVASVRVLYPAPVRMKDASGESVGYKSSVVFPVEVKAKDPAQPVVLKLAMEFGVCREICVPAEAKLEMTLPPVASIGTDPAVAKSIAAALESVPRPAAERRPTDPELKAVDANLTGDKPTLTIDAAFPGGTAGADLFLEISDGVYVPMPKAPGVATGGATRFTVDLSTGVEPAELKGRTLTLTLVSPTGSSEATAKLPQ